MVYLTKGRRNLVLLIRIYFPGDKRIFFGICLQNIKTISCNLRIIEYRIKFVQKIQKEFALKGPIIETAECIPQPPARNGFQSSFHAT